MKRNLLIGITAFVALVLSGCFVSLDNGAGSVGIEIPPPRSITGEPLGDVGRIYVINGSSSLPLQEDGTGYVEFELPDDGTTLESYSVGPVPSGDGYQVNLVFGSYANGVDGNGVFVPSVYALSQPLTVYAGQATETELLVLQNPGLGVETSLLGRDLTGLAIGAGAIFTMTNDTLYSLPITLDSAATAYPMGQSDATSMNLGSWGGESQLWINTETGLLPFWLSGGSALSFMALNFGDTFQPSPILSSGAFTDGTNTYGYYQFEGGIGGVYDDGNDGLDGWMDEADLSEIVVGQPVYDLAVDLEGGTNIDGYFATKLGALMLQEEDVRRTDPAVAREVRDVLRDSTFFEISIDGTKVAITNLAIDGSDLFIGTPRGVAVVDKTAVSSLTETTATTTPVFDVVSAEIVPGSAGLVTKQLAMGSNYKAILTENVILVQAGSGDWKEFPVSATVSSEITSIFLDNLSGVVLAVGDRGFSYFDIDDL